jgi:hypothetical protein
MPHLCFWNAMVLKYFDRNEWVGAAMVWDDVDVRV